MNAPKLRFKNYEDPYNSYQFNELVTNKVPKYNPKQNATNTMKCIELEHLSSNTGTLLGYTSSENQSSIKNIFEVGSVLYGKLRPYLKKYYFSDFKGVCSTEIWVLNSLSNKLINKYLYQIVQTSRYDEIVSKSIGSKMPRADWNSLAESEFHFPLIEEQKKVSDFLTLLDKNIQKQQKKIDKLKELKKGIMQKIFMQELLFKNENGKRYPEWEKAYLHNLGKFGKSYSYSRAVEGDGIFRYIHYGDIHSNYPSVCENVEFPTITNVQQFELIIDNDIVFADASEDYTDLGKAILIKNVNGQEVIAGLHTHKFTPNERLNTLYFIYFTQTRAYQEFIKKMGTGVSVLGISKTNLYKLEVLLPSIKEQEKIGHIMYLLDQKIQRENDKMKILTIRKKSFMQQMFI